MTTTEMTKGQAFVERVEQLDSGRLAMLRRGCGARDPVEGRCPWLIGLIRGAASEATAFLAASLLAQYSTADIKAGRHRMTGDFGKTWKVATASEGESIKRRFNTVLDAEYDPWTGEGDLPHRLRQMVRYAVSKRVGVDWPQLVADLCYWSHPDKPVQKHWARSFFASEPEDKETESQEKE